MSINTVLKGVRCSIYRKKESIHDLISLCGPVRIFICESMRGMVENFVKKSQEGVKEGRGLEIFPSRDL